MNGSGVSLPGSTAQDLTSAPSEIIGVNWSFASAGVYYQAQSSWIAPSRETPPEWSPTGS